MKIVVNRCFGGFGLSPIATKLAVEAGVPCKPYKYEKEHSLHAKDEKLLNLGDGWELWGRPPRTDSMFGSVVKDGMVYYLSESDIAFRSHPGLVSVVEKLGAAANAACAKLEVVDVPDGVEVHIEEYDGAEHVAEDHRTW